MMVFHQVHRIDVIMNLQQKVHQASSVMIVHQVHRWKPPVGTFRPEYGCYTIYTMYYILCLALV